MRTIQKVAFSLLIAVVLFAVFAILAFSGLFDVIESRFYNRRITSAIKDDVLETKKSIDEYNAQNIERFLGVLQLDYIQRSYLPNRSREDIFNTDNAILKIKSEVPGFLFTRFIDEQGNIHFSTFDDDIKRKTDFSLIYEKLENVDPQIPFQELVISEGETPGIFIDGIGSRIIYRLPFYDNVGLYKGTALFYIGKKGLRDNLIRMGSLTEGNSFTLLHKKGYIFNSDIISEDFLHQEVFSRLDKLPITDEIENFPIASDATGQKYFLFSIFSPDSGYVCYLIDESFFSLNTFLKYILLASFFLTTFLILFLIFNFKQDKFVVLSERVKRFQINFLKGYIENKDEVNWEQWKLDLGRKREKLKREIKSGIGQLEGKEGEEVDTLIEKSWDEILGVIGKKADRETPAKVEVSNKIEIENLEKVFEKVLTSGRIVLPTRLTETAVSPRQIGVEELEEVAEAEPVEELEEIAEAEPVEEVEEIAEAEAVEEVAEAEAVEEAEEIVEEELVEVSDRGEHEEGIDLLETSIEEEDEQEPLEELEVVLPIPLAPPVEPPQEVLEMLNYVDNEEREANLEMVSGTYDTFSLFGQSYSVTRGSSESWKKVLNDEPVDLLEVEVSEPEEPRPKTVEEETLDESQAAEEVQTEEIPEKAMPEVAPEFLEVLDSLIKENRIEVKTLTEIGKLYENKPEAVGIENGIYKIKEEVFEAKSKPSDTELRELVREVVREEDRDKHSGIDHLFSSTGIELPFFEREKGEIKSDEGKQQEAIDNAACFDDHGLNFSCYTRKYGRGSSGELRTIKTISKEVGAIIAAVLTEEEDSFQVHVSLGMDAESQNLVRFDCERDFTRYFLLEEKLLLMQGLCSEIESMKVPLSDNDAAYIEGILFLPMTYNDRKAYLFLGLKNGNIPIEAIVHKLIELVL